MKKIIFSLLLIINISCFSSNEKKSELQEVQNSFLECLDETEKQQLISLKKSFDKFIKTNYNSSRVSFLEDMLNEKTKEYTFEKSDSALIIKLRQDSFLNIANQFTTKEKFYKYLNEPRRSQAIAKIKGEGIWGFEYSRNYLKCIKAIPQKDSLTIQYVKIKNAVGDLSSHVLSNSLLYSLNKNYEREDEMIDYILIVEFYYYILNWKINKS